MDPSSQGTRSNTTTNSTKHVVNQTSPKKATSTTKELSPHYVRSYTCTFCEKGFSNAQALGGHMNIHRRDRARLRNLDDSDLGTKHATMITWERNHHADDQGRSNGGGGGGGDHVDLELRLGSPSSSSAPKTS